MCLNRGKIGHTY
ncbi:hypothetical protein F383_21011 [Gossypium arboreum]|uniref:Uncharacterized protein n=1 Tax=Gossypium arboreum TaxID=29729 RepID=A0A0B0MKH1_GOSAR|nr:hypothetical protein F383_21011 [Gossypium arboreum]